MPDSLSRPAAPGGLATAAPVVGLEGLAIDFHTGDGVERVIKDVTLRIDPGEIVGLVGESGCGKSVTAKMLLGILPMPPAVVSGGRVEMFGRDLATIAPAEREALKKFVAYVPQDPSAVLNPSFTVASQMIDMIVWYESDRRLSTYFRKRHTRAVVARARDFAASLLEKVYIADPSYVLRRYPVQLSGGMRQRVLLAMALSGTPQLMIADEPTTALDVTVQKRTVELLRDLVQREGLAGLYITHDLGVAREICARTYVMYAGSTVEDGPTGPLLDRPLHPYTRGLVDAIPSLAGGLPKAIAGQVPDYLAPPPGCRFAPRCPDAFERCRRTPSRVEPEPGRRVACWLFEEEEAA
ncbi:ABC transporter ATP-binding protein [Reyranella sp.]|uniref:ABC transporter ATP-binding protein n=1 Tax=Reyranella sp. TaxID=1929291 RepID=UPI003BACE712